MKSVICQQQVKETKYMGSCYMMKKLKASDADQPLASVCFLKCFCSLPLPSKMVYLHRTEGHFFVLNTWASDFKDCGIMSLIWEAE